MMSERDHSIQGQERIPEPSGSTKSGRSGGRDAGAFPDLQRFRLNAIAAELPSLDGDYEDLDGWQNALPYRMEAALQGDVGPLSRRHEAERPASDRRNITLRSDKPTLDTGADAELFGLMTIPAGVERLPTEEIREAYFKMLVRYQDPNPHCSVSDPRFISALQMMRELDEAPTLSQRQAWRELERSVREYVSTCAPMTPDAEVGSIFFSDPRTVHCPTGETLQVMRAEIRNRAGESLLCFDGKLKSYEFDAPVAMLVARAPGSQIPFQFEVVYSRAAYEADIAELRESSGQLFNEFEYPYLMRRLKCEIARRSNESLAYELQEKGCDAGGVIEALGKAADLVDILGVEYLGKQAPSWDAFSVVTTQGRYVVHFAWSEHDYNVSSFTLEMS